APSSHSGIESRYRVPCIGLRVDAHCKFVLCESMTSFEVKIMPMLEASGVQVIAVGLGSAANAQEFARDLRFPATKLFADPSGAAYKALGFNPGFLPDLDISPYAKLLPMLAGVGSEGTLQEVVRGYVGDRAAQPVFDRATPFDILGTGYQRPFELATLRLFNMVGVLSRWNVLSPPNQALLTQQGGTLAFDGQDVIFKHVDSGILKYTDTEALLRVVLNADIVADAQVLPAITDVLAILLLGHHWRALVSAHLTGNEPIETKPLRVVCIGPYEPIVMCDPAGPQESYTGYEVELFRKSAAYLASQGHTEWLPEAYVFNCSDWDYIMADLLLPASQRTCDMAFQGMSATSERIAAGYQFSGPDYASGREIMVFMSLKPDMWLFLRPFSSTVGGCGLWAPFASAFKARIASLGTSTASLIFYPCAAYQEALQQFNARSTGARIIILGYIAVLASQLTVNSINTNINGISDLVNKPVGIFVDAALMLESLRNGKVSALILDAPYVETQVAKNCDLYKVGSTVLPNGLAFAFGPDVSADYIAHFSHALIVMEEQGIKENLKQLFVSPASSCSNKAGGSLSSSTIGIEKLAGLWVFLGAAVGGGFTWNLLAALFARVQRARSGDESLERRRSMSGSMSGNAILPSCESAGSMHGGIRSKSFAAMNPEMAWLGVAEASTLEEGMEVLEGHVKVMDARMKRMFEAMQQQLSAISSALQGQQDGMPGDASLQLTSKKSSGAKSLNMRSVQISLPGSEVQDVTGHISVPQPSPAAAASKLSKAASSPTAPPPTQPAPPSQRPEPRQPSPRATAAGAALAPVSGEDRAILGTATATAAAPQPAAVREGQGSPPAQHDTVLDFHDM
ncbi:hypothetical protein QJQ45_017184, partial [Haematococcus lacustris]